MRGYYFGDYLSHDERNEWMELADEMQVLWNRGISTDDFPGRKRMTELSDLADSRRNSAVAAWKASGYAKELEPDGYNEAMK